MNPEHATDSPRSTPTGSEAEAGSGGATDRRTGPSIRIIEGEVWAFFAFDIGYAIDLDVAQQLVAPPPGAAARSVSSEGGRLDIDGGGERTSRETIRHRRRTVSAPQFHPAPLRIEQRVGALQTIDLVDRGGATGTGSPLFRVAPRFECTLYDFGAVSVGYRIHIDGGAEGLPLADLIPLTQAIMEGDVLRVDAKERVTALANRIRTAIDRPEIAEIIEDYTVIHVRRRVGNEDAMTTVTDAAPSIARVLMAESGALSAHAIETATSTRLSYAPDDAAVLDWNGALLLGPDEDDSIAVLEFANVELLEMRFLDDRLDAVLDRSYVSLLRHDRRGRPPRSPLGLLFDPHRAERRWLADLQMESAVLFENANNTLKLVGDQHLARLYASAAKRLHLADWDQSILRKLETVEGLYQKLADEQAARRMEVLEWIIIILIAVSIVLPFIPGVQY